MKAPEPEPIPVPALDDEPKRWPVHQRLIGAGVKAAFASLGALPMAFYVLAKSFRRWEWEWLWGLAAGVLCALVVFVWERRGAKWWAAALRLAATGTCITVVAPLAFVWLENLGDPSGAYQDLTQVMRLDRLLGFLLAAVGFACVFPLFGVWIYVRNRTASLLPQIAAGVVTLAVPAVVMFADRPAHNVGWAFFWLATAVLVPLGTWFGDRVAKRWDPDAPTPAGGDLRMVWAVSGVLTWLAFSLPLGMILHRIRRTYGDRSRPALQSLRRLTTAQLLYRAGDKNADGVPDFAGGITELGHERLIDANLAGGYQGLYVFRVIRGSDDPNETWAAAADPVVPHLDQHFVTNHEGVVYSSRRAIPLDSKTCKLPEGLGPVY